MKKFEILDIAGDVGLKAFGESKQEVFVHAAMGMYSLITNTDVLKDKKPITVAVESHALDGLLVAWLNELIFHFDAYGFVGKRIVVDEFPPTLTLPPQGPACHPSGRGGMGGGETFRLKATVYGEDFDPEHHEGKLLIKAATYHKLRIEKINDMWEIDVIFDI